MEKHLSATETVRGFSEILNTIKFTGAHYIIERNGKPIASLKPVSEVNRSKPLKELKTTMASLPDLGEEVDEFSADLNVIINSQPPMPEQGQWG